MPGRRPAGGESSLTFTANETTPLEPPAVATGSIEVTLPRSEASSAATLTVASCPTLMAATSLSTTLVEIRRSDEIMVIAAPAGASSPTLIAIRGDNAVRGRRQGRGSSECLERGEIRLRPLVRGLGVVQAHLRLAARGSGARVLAIGRCDLELERGGLRGSGRLDDLRLEVGGVRGREDLPGRHAVADRDLHLGNRPGHGRLGRVAEGERRIGPLPRRCPLPRSRRSRPPPRRPRSGASTPRSWTA